jgi:hypothetical protein
MKNNYHNKKKYHHPTFVQYKKNSYQFISSLPYEKKLNKKKKKNLKYWVLLGPDPRASSLAAIPDPTIIFII